MCIAESPWFSSLLGDASCCKCGGVIESTEDPASDSNKSSATGLRNMIKSMGICSSIVSM